MNDITTSDTDRTATTNKAEGYFVLDEATREKAAGALQAPLVELINAALLTKQAHWVVRGRGFNPAHEKLDEVVNEIQASADDCAERMVTLGFAPDGRPSTIALSASGNAFRAGFHNVDDAISGVLVPLHTAIKSLRDAQAVLADLDPISEDLVIGIAQGLEKQRWMLEAELDN